MSHLLDSYRRNAEAARLTASTATLHNVRVQAEEAAQRWDEMIDRLQWVEAQQQLRAAAIVPQTYTSYD